MNTEARLLENEPAVLRLFAAESVRGKPPIAVRAVRWQYWFTTKDEKKRTGAWWRRELRGLYAPIAVRTPDGRIGFAER